MLFFILVLLGDLLMKFPLIDIPAYANTLPVSVKLGQELTETGRFCDHVVWATCGVRKGVPPVIFGATVAMTLES